jgi:hypothetical protein
MARMVRRPSARTAILAIIRMRARRMATGDRVTSQTAFSLESARGGDGDSGTDFTVTDFMVTTDSVTDLMVVGSLAADSMAGRDLEIGQALPTMADSVVESPAVEAAASPAAEEASMGAADSTEAAAVVDSTEVAVVSMAAVVVDSMEVAADMAVATGN